MPFGLTCAPSVFQRLMDVVLCGLSYQICLVYLDDIIVFGQTFEEQLERLEEVFKCLRSANLKLKPSKCFLCQCSVEFLGHVVSEKGLTMQSSKIEAINNWTSCRDVSFECGTSYQERWVASILCGLSTTQFDYLQRQLPPAVNR